MSKMEYTDEEGLHVMCACGHYVSGGVKPGQKMMCCPNCMLASHFQRIPVVYPEQLPKELRDNARAESDRRDTA